MTAEARQAKRLIIPPGDLPMVAVRAEYAGICDGDGCAAALLNLFERFSVWKRDNNFGAWEWVYVSLDELPGLLMNIWGRNTCVRSIQRLRERGFLTARHNPDNPRDRQLQYRFETALVQAAVDGWQAVIKLAETIVQIWQMHRLNINDGQFKSKRCIEPKQTMDSLDSDDASFKLGQRSLYLDSFSDPSLDPALESSSSSPERVRETRTPDDDDDSKPIQPPEPIEVPKDEPSVYALYAENIGKITPYLRDELVDAVREKGEPAVRTAIHKAVEYNARNWKYIRAVLEGKPKPQPAATQDGNRFITGEFAAFIEH